MLSKLFDKGRDFLGVEHPIISGGMTWISDFALVKAVSEAGAFPVFASGNMPPDLFEKEVDRLVNEIKNPFAVNLITIAPNYRDHFNILLRKNVPFVVFAGSFPTKNDVVTMKEAGKKTISFASTESIAEKQIKWGIDALILEGSEAGGHIGNVSLIVLLQQVLFKFREFPIFVSGGLATGEIVAHLLLMGAYGVQMGTRFVMSDECTAHENFKKAFKRARARTAIATPQYDNKLPVVAVRALRNKGMENFGKLQLELLKKLEKDEINRSEAQWEVENYWAGSLRKAVEEGDVETGSLMAGQSVGLISDIKPLKEIIQDIVNDAMKELERVKTLL
ncbi:MAG: nitronate monooxygenase family protein [Candidatus Zophobacter franzmannii]|nr:nitronate monooxygenase family protein [Candidatus Zophobacter franzmannii]